MSDALSGKWAEAKAKVALIADMKDPVERNKAINGFYAGVFLDRPEMAWAGLAAFASKEVGAQLQNPLAMPLRGKLAEGNKEVFSDIAPLLAFYHENIGAAGPEQMQQWVDQLKKTGEIPRSLQVGMQAALRKPPDLDVSVGQFVEREQRDILQEGLYRDGLVRSMLYVNRLSHNTLAPIEISFTAAPAASAGLSDPARLQAHMEASEGLLYHYKDRMNFIGRVQQTFLSDVRDPVTGSQIVAALVTLKSQSPLDVLTPAATAPTAGPPAGQPVDQPRFNQMVRP